MIGLILTRSKATSHRFPAEIRRNRRAFRFPVESKRTVPEESFNYEQYPSGAETLDSETAQVCSLDSKAR